MPYLLKAGSRINRIWWRKRPFAVLRQKDMRTTKDCIIYWRQLCGALDETHGEKMFLALKDRELYISLVINDEYGIDVLTTDMIKI